MPFHPLAAPEAALSTGRIGRTLGLLTVALLLAAAAPTSASRAANRPAEAPAYDAVRLETAEITVDGRLDEPEWQQATVIDQFWEWSPGENVEPPVATEFRLLFDERALYVAAIARDPEPERIRAHLMDRDAIETLVQDDYISLLLDTFNDHRRAFQFRINAFGVQADALNGYVTGFEDWSWDILWDAAGRLTDDGYQVELRIPLNQLPYPTTDAADPGTWRISFGRSWPRDQRHRIVSYPFRFGDSCATCAFNQVSGFSDLAPGRSLEVVPTLTAGRTDRRPSPDQSFESGDEDADLGVSGRWNLSQSTRLSFAVNPDFSQVEADAAQLNVNERFALFFPEQRPFFLEDVDVFNTPLQAVFSRTVANPEWGLKLTSKQGSNTFGVFATQDDVNNLILPGNQGSRFVSSRDGTFDNEVLGGVVRYRRDMGQRNSIGVLYAGRESDDYSNHVYGFDGSFRLAAADTINVQVLHSDTQYPFAIRDRFGLDDDEVGGEAVRINYFHNTRDWEWSANFNRLDAGFRADSGFIPRVDLVSLGGRVERKFWYDDHWLTVAGFGGNVNRSEDTAGRLTDSKIGLSSFARGPKQSLLFGQIWTIDKRNRNTLFEDLTGGEFYFEVVPTGKLRVELYSSYEDEVDFANDRETQLFQYGPEFDLKIGKRIQASLDLFRRTFSNDSGTYLRADLAELKFYYHFSTRSFLRAIVQRTEQVNDPSQFVFPVERRVEDVFSQLLFSYKLNAQTVLFAGYSDNRIGDEMRSLTATDRSVFFKVGYAFVL